jgi:quinol monooxygenase YgiN
VRVSELISIARATATPGRAEELEHALRERIAPTRAQRGNLEFVLFRSIDDGATMLAIERWASRGDWERHQQGPHVASLIEIFNEVLAGPPSILLASPAAGQPA